MVDVSLIFTWYISIVDYACGRYIVFLVLHGVCWCSGFIYFLFCVHGGWDCSLDFLGIVGCLCVEYALVNGKCLCLYHGWFAA